MRIFTKIEPLPDIPKRKRVGIYCRVSSKHEAQLASLANQVSYFTRVVMNKPGWWLTDIYIDIKSAETINPRTEFLRLLQDCRNGNLDLVITKSISRFGRDTLDLLNAIRELRELGVAVLFDQEAISTDEPDSEFITTIFEMYLDGESLVGIISRLKSSDVKTATGKDKWSKNTLDKMLSNEKYCGDVVLFKSYSFVQLSPVKIKRRKENKGEVERYMCVSNHPAIIPKDTFEAVQAEKARRSNVEITDNGTKRRGTHYSKKRDAVKP